MAACGALKLAVLPTPPFRHAAVCGLFDWRSGAAAKDGSLAVVVDVSHSMTAALGGKVYQVLKSEMDRIATHIDALGASPGGCIVFREAGDIREGVVGLMSCAKCGHVSAGRDICGGTYGSSSTRYSPRVPWLKPS